MFQVMGDDVKQWAVTSSMTAPPTLSAFPTHGTAAATCADATPGSRETVACVYKEVSISTYVVYSHCHCH